VRHVYRLASTQRAELRRSGMYDGERSQTDSIAPTQRPKEARCLQQLQPREVLRIDNADRLLVVINHDQIVDAMALEQVENFHG
jgi:hypothetical protein